MNVLKVVVAAAAVGVILVAFRDFENQRWLLPAGAGGTRGSDEETEPILGYDGMDQETLIDWLSDAGVDRATLRRMRRYEAANRSRDPVLNAIDDLL